MLSVAAFDASTASLTRLLRQVPLPGEQLGRQPGEPSGAGWADWSIWRTPELRWVTGMLLDSASASLHTVWLTAGAFIGAVSGAWVGGQAGQELATNTLGSFFSSSPGHVLAECYAMLQIDSMASVKEVRRAHRLRSRIFHPDKGGTNEQMTRLNLCKEIVEIAHKNH